MPKTVLIILAAVVALIVIVVLTGMRYLRADDEDDFDDNVSAEHGRSRSRGSHPVAGQTRNRQVHASDPADERPRERVGAARGIRPVQERDNRAGQRGADQRALDHRGSGRGGQDRSWREDSAMTARSGRAARPARDQRPARTTRRDHDDISEPLTAVRAPRTSARDRGDDYDSLPGRRTSSAEHDRDRRSGRERASGYDDFAAHSDGRDSRDRRDRSDSWPGRDGRDRSDLRDSGPVPSIRDDADRDDRDRRSSTRPNARPDARKNGSKPDDELLPAVKPRQTKNKRESEGDWPSNEWDELSDVDYWAELASDKPFSAGSTDEAPRSERRAARSEREVASERTARAERAGRTDRESRQDRDARQDSRIGAEAITKQMSRPPREPDSEILPAARHRDLPPADRPTAARAADPRPAIADDDPLTSPSFPRVAADDSRSYRRSRSAGPDSRHDGGRGSDASRQPLPGGRTSGERSSYPSMPPVEPVRGYDNASTTRRHALPAASAPAASDAYPAPAPGYAADPSAGIADPYGLPLPSAPPPASSSVPASYQVPAVSGAYQAPGASYGVPDGANGSHSLSAPYAEPAGYPAAAGYSSPPPAAYREANGSPASGYLPPAGGSAGFAADARSGSYQSLPPAPDSYRTDLGPGGYQGGGAGYDLTGYESTSSYSPPSSPAGYGNGNGTGDRPAEYPGNGYQNGDYQGYGEATSASGSHRRPEPGYSQGSYQGASGPSMPALPAAPPEPGYPAYQAPVPNGQNGYPPANPQPPGYGAAPYPPAGYDQAGYPVPAPEANGYAGADPYAADPYGQHGYPGNGY